MAQYLTIARPYAKAVFEQAMQDDHLHQWQLILRAMAMISQHPQVKHLINDPELPGKDLQELYVETVCTVIADLSADIKTKLTNLLAMLITEKRLAIIPAITQLYQKMLAEHENTLRVQVTSAAVLSSEQKQAIEAALSKRFQLKMATSYDEDPDLIGGAVISSGNWVMDGSVKTKLARLRQALAN